ncbi:MAG: riboflavin synthase [Phycisphaerales bacterium]|jgi:riboflavin synthase
MFTGIIESVCTVKSARQSGKTMLLTVDLDTLAEDCKPSDSIAVNGVCLTISRLEGNIASFEISAETLKKSTLSKLQPLSQVNIERAVKPTDRLGGHIVQGHIDGTATIKLINRRDNFADIKFSTDTKLLDNMVLKGSVAVDGISLTVADIDDNSFSVAVIPETLNRTTLGKAKISEQVNIETDIIIKIIKKQLEKILPQKQQLTTERLREMGF